ncbi:cytochrome oxidase assembly protein-domain-containing protein [Lipomyces japonicus]|uniref:cytochrome oxidase assembly protein-domain-containing protein n=1 Tax=Lipomyces japonicus TaxID=56871 RepID=UPI0034CF76F8
MSKELLSRPALFFLHNLKVKAVLQATNAGAAAAVCQKLPPPPSRLGQRNGDSGSGNSLVTRYLPWMSTTTTMTSWNNSSAGRVQQDVVFNSQSKRRFSSSIQRMSSEAATITSAKASTTGQDAKPKVIVTDKAVGYWLLGSSALVFGIVIIGGLTRLTESGLSITEWKPVAGMLPPLTEQDWQAEFNKYQSSPEYKLLNSHMSLQEFKFIFFMEWSHRLWGRLIGLTFVIPGAYFILRGRTSTRVTKRIWAIAGLIGLQGFIGWWMVKSGLSGKFLDDSTLQDGKFRDNHPRVSQYRLATHLGAAFVAYLAMLWTGVEILREHRWVRQDPKTADATIKLLSNPALRRYRVLARSLLGLVFLTAMSGAFVAGLDAGLIYNQFPYMGETIVPPVSELFSTFYTRNENDSDLIWRNLLENPTTVQFNHRVLAVTTFTAVVLLHVYATRLYGRGLLPRAVFKASHGTIGFASLQVALGISTLLYLVPVPLAAAHQAGSLALLTYVLLLCSRLKLPRQSMQRLIQAALRNQQRI